MKTPFLPSLIAAAFFFGTSLVNGQQTPAEEPPAGERPQRRDQGERPRGPALEGMTEEQRKAMQEFGEANRKIQQEIGEKMRAARRSVEEAIHAETVNEDTIRAKVAEVSKLEAELAIAQAKAFAQLRKVLTPEQYTRVKNMRAMGMGNRMGGPEGQRGPRPERGERPEGRPQPPH